MKILQLTTLAALVISTSACLSPAKSTIAETSSKIDQAVESLKNNTNSTETTEENSTTEVPKAENTEEETTGTENDTTESDSAENSSTATPKADPKADDTDTENNTDANTNNTPTPKDDKPSLLEGLWKDKNEKVDLFAGISTEEPKPKVEFDESKTELSDLELNTLETAFHNAISNTAEITGVQAKFSDEENSVKPTLDSSHLDSISIDGQELTLFTEDERQSSDVKKFIKNIDNGGILGDSSYQALRYGVIFKNADENDETDATVGNIFIQGKLTEQIPVTGVFTYTGNAIYGDNNDGGWFDKLYAEANVDFAEKKLKVNIKEDADSEEANFSFGGKFNQNIFSGNNNGIAYSGAFYGKNAQEMGGIFYRTDDGDENGKHGVFGVSQTKSE